MVIVYRSNTGFTREYAEMLGRAEKIKVYSVTEAERSLESGTEIFYMGPLMAGHRGCGPGGEAISGQGRVRRGALPLWPAGAGNHLQSQLCAKRPYFLFAGGLGP